MCMFELSGIAVVTILGMAFAMYATRIGGFWILGQFETSECFQAWLGYIPAAVFTSLIAPEIVRGGPPEWAAGFAVLGTAIRTGNLLYAMIAGFIVLLVVRQSVPV